MSVRIRQHLRSNVVGYLALFIALSGTAWAAGQIGSKDIKKNAIRSKHIKDGQVHTADIGDAQVTGAKLSDGSVGTQKIAGDAITSGLIGPGQVGAGDLADGAVTSAKIADGSVTGGDVADGSLSGDDVENSSLTGADIGTGSITATQIADIGELESSGEFVLNPLDGTSGTVTLLTNGTFSLRAKCSRTGGIMTAELVVASDTAGSIFTSTLNPNGIAVPVPGDTVIGTLAGPDSNLDYAFATFSGLDPFAELMTGIVTAAVNTPVEGPHDCTFTAVALG